jgi:hypothetical protein
MCSKKKTCCCSLIWMVLYNCVVCAMWWHLVGPEDEGSMNGKCLFARFLLSGQMLLPPIYMQGS